MTEELARTRALLARIRALKNKALDRAGALSRREARLEGVLHNLEGAARSGGPDDKRGHYPRPGRGSMRERAGAADCE